MLTGERGKNCEAKTELCQASSSGRAAAAVNRAPRVSVPRSTVGRRSRPVYQSTATQTTAASVKAAAYATWCSNRLIAAEWPIAAAPFFLASCRPVTRTAMSTPSVPTPMKAGQAKR